jgi:tRNA1(Val) A37 N6-methylase TrmN6
VSADLFLDGAVAVRQDPAGYRAGADAVFLAASLAAAPGERLLEPGCGAGAALLMAARRLPEARFTGLERDPALAALARENVAANAMQDRVEIVAGDVADPPAPLRTDRFDQVFLNPPFYAPGEGRAPKAEKSGAFVEGEADLPVWIDFALRRLTDKGRLTLIHRAARLDQILSLLRGRAGGATIKPLAPAAGAPAVRVIVTARKGSNAPLRLLPPLVLHEDGAHSPEADAILRGRAALDLS